MFELKNYNYDSLPPFCLLNVYIDKSNKIQILKYIFFYVFMGK